MNKDLIKKLVEEQPLDLAESFELEQALERQDSSMLKMLDRPEPSMAWRSRLNERLVALEPRPRRKWVLFSGTTVVALAAALFVFVVLPRDAAPKATEAPSELELALADAHGAADAAAQAGVLVPDWGG